MSFALFYCQPAQHTFSFPFTMQSYLLVVPVLQGVILLVGTLFTVFGNCFPVKFVGSFCLATDKASVLTPELPDIMRLFKIRQPVRSIVLCKNADTPCIHLMKLVFFGLLETKGVTHFCSVPAGTVGHMGFCEWCTPTIFFKIRFKRPVIAGIHGWYISCNNF